MSNFSREYQRIKNNYVNVYQKPKQSTAAQGNHVIGGCETKASEVALDLGSRAPRYHQMLVLVPST